MRERLISNYNEETGISTVTIINRYGKFTGTSTLLEEDRPFESHLAGCRFAEMKAQVKYFKERMRREAATIKALENFQKVIVDCKGYNEKSTEARQLRKQIYLHKHCYETFRACKESLEIKIKEHIDYRDKVVRKAAEKKGKNN